MVLIIKNENLYFGASNEIIRRARLLRKVMTNSEAILWENLRDNKFLNLKFRRQHPIHKFIVDFYCHSLKLIIELDGKVHLEESQHERDEGRTYELQKLGVFIIRFKNETVIADMPKIYTEIEKFVK